MSQPVEVYPISVMKEPESSHSKGSFGPVFVVLAVIVVISAVACVVGRLCSRGGHHRPREAHHRAKVVSHHHDHDQPTANKLQSHGLGPREWESRQKPIINLRERGDQVDLGSDHRRVPSANMGNNGGGMVMPPHYGFINGGNKDVRFADNV